MKKTILKTLTIASLLAVMSPAVVNAATLSADKKDAEMKVGETVLVTVSTDKPVETIQFDLNYDKNKYKYASMETDLKSAGSNLINNNDTVRVSAFGENGEKTQKVTLKFEATNPGDSIPFSIDQSKTIELGEDGEKLDNVKIEVKKIVGKATVDSSTSTVDTDSQYVDEFGNIIKRLPQTNAKKSLGTFENLVTGKIIVPYALSNTDNSIYLTDLKDEFGSNIQTSLTNATDRVKTGDTFTLNGTTYTVVIYGDVNKDGKVTTADALTVQKAKDKQGQNLNDIQLLAGDVENTNVAVETNASDAKAIQAYILQARAPKTGTIINVNPSIEEYTLETNNLNSPMVAYKKLTVATVIFNSNAVELTEDLFAFEITKAPSDDAKNNAIIKYEKDAEGNFAVNFYTTVAGNYEITPMVNGVAQQEQPFTFNIVENNAITDIKLVDDNGNAVSDVVALKSEQFAKTKIKFYHQNYDIDGNAIGQPIELTNINATHVTIAKTGSIKEIDLYDNTANGGKPIFGVGQTTPTNSNPIDSLFVEAETIYSASEGSVTITVDNTSYGIDNYTKNVIVSLSPAVERLFVNGRELSAGQITLDLFTSMPSRTDVTVVEDDGLFYTILPIELKDENNQPLKLTTDDIKNVKTGTDTGVNGEIVINKKGDKNAIALEGFVKSGNTYTLSTNTSNPIDAIGIAIEYENNVAELLKGLTLTYDKISADGKTVSRVTTDIEVKVDNDVTTKTTSQDNSEIAPVVEEMKEPEETEKVDPVQETNNSNQQADAEEDNDQALDGKEEEQKEENEDNENNSSDANNSGNQGTDGNNTSEGNKNDVDENTTGETRSSKDQNTLSTENN